MSAAPKGWTSTRDSHDNANGRTAATKREVRYEGRSLGGFRIVREIACGGMATVYLGHRIQHARVGQAAAVKVIHPHLARNPDFVNMFLDEARIVSSISHPNVCRVLDFGHAEDTYYLAMEYVLGESLADLLIRIGSKSADNIAVPLITQVMYQVCEALHAVHEARDAEGKPLHVVHRDISPQNIMVGYDGCVRVLDFGVARATERLHITRAGVIKGRLAYMAPEQMRGAVVDRRADLWSVGAVLWEGLAGKRLFKRDNDVQTIHAVTLEPVPPVPPRARVLPESLQRVVARALERDPARRYDSARELGLDLLRSESQQAHASMSDVSAWMHSLFSEAIAQKRELLREAALAASAERQDEPIDVTVEEEEEEEVETRVAVPVPPEIRRAAMAATGDSDRSDSGSHRAGVRNSGIQYSPSETSGPTDSGVRNKKPTTPDRSGIQPAGAAHASESPAQPSSPPAKAQSRAQRVLMLVSVMVLLVAPEPCSAPSSEAPQDLYVERTSSSAVASSVPPSESFAKSRSHASQEHANTGAPVITQLSSTTDLTQAPTIEENEDSLPATLTDVGEALVAKVTAVADALAPPLEPSAVDAEHENAERAAAPEPSSAGDVIVANKDAPPLAAPLPTDTATPAPKSTALPPAPPAPQEAENAALEEQESSPPLEAKDATPRPAPSAATRVATPLAPRLTAGSAPVEAKTTAPRAPASAAPRAAQPAPRGTPRALPLGLVNIETTSGWAHVFYGTRKIGTTPLRTSLPVGMRVLRFLPNGRGPILVRRIEVNERSPATLTLTLD